MFRQALHDIKPYPAPPEGRVGLHRYDMSECTIPPSRKVLDALHEFVESGNICCYPDGYSDLHAKIADNLGVKAEQIRATNGADGAIETIAFATVDEGSKVIIPSPSFGMFYLPVGVQGADILKPSYGNCMSFPLFDMLDMLDNETKLVIVCNPNNPTGTLVNHNDIEQILQKASGTAVMVDEVYSEFTGVSVVDLIDKYDNLFVVKSFSKAWALAGARVGYIVSQEQNITELGKVATPYNVNQFGVVAAMAALEDPSYMHEYVDEVMNHSKPMLVDYLRGTGLNFYEGSANFVLVNKGSPQRAYERLKENYDILVRPQKGELSHMIRVGVGTCEDTKRFISAFDEVLKE